MTTVPRLNTVTLSAPRSASSSLCVISTTAPPASAKARARASSSSTSLGASTPVGSSSSSTRASAASAFTISRRCSSATGRVPARASGSSGRLSRSARALTRVLSSRGRTSHPAKSAMFSATVSAGIEVKCWCTRPIPASRASRGDRSRFGVPSIRISPASGDSIPAATCISVVLPAPFSPSSACTSPARTTRPAPVSACTVPNRLWMLRSSRIGPGHMPVG